MKTKLTFSIVVLIVIIVVVIALLLFRSRAGTSKSQTPTEITNVVLPINQRPYFTITSAKSPINGSFDGKFYLLSISNAPADTSVDYELAYETSTVPRGTVGSATFSNGKYEREDFFGTKSTKDYHFDTGVEFGKTTLTVKSSTNEYEIEADFRLQKIGPAKTLLSDRNNTFELQIPAGAVSKSAAIISQRTVGLPQIYSSKFLLDQPISFLTQATTTLAKSAVLKIKVDKNSSGKVVIVGWDGKGATWREFETTFDPQTEIAQANVDLLSTYIVVEKLGI